MKILVCEDDPSVINIVQYKLKQEGFEDLLFASNSLEALTMLKLHSIKLIILDLYLPPQSGLNIISFVRKDQCFKTPILVLSATDSQEKILKAIELGADDYLKKPFSFSELITRVKILLQK